MELIDALSWERRPEPVPSERTLMVKIEDVVSVYVDAGGLVVKYLAQRED